MAFETPRGAGLFDEGFGLGRRDKALDPRVSFVLPRCGESRRRGRRHVRGRRNGIAKIRGVDSHALRHQVRTGSANRSGHDILRARFETGFVEGIIAAVDVGHGLRGR